ncbi:MAG: hypothetical protein IPK97_12285 [Ahniella sp.]|nr:hypothetical protein [Ahniella sp.]
MWCPERITQIVSTVLNRQFGKPRDDVVSPQILALMVGLADAGSELPAVGHPSAHRKPHVLGVLIECRLARTDSGKTVLDQGAAGNAGYRSFGDPSGTNTCRGWGVLAERRLTRNGGLQMRRPVRTDLELTGDMKAVGCRRSTYWPQLH